MITITRISYTNEAGESIDVNFEETDIEDRADRINDLAREMLAGGREMGPPPQKKPEGGQSAWIGGE